jgi:hypothetical protein
LSCGGSQAVTVIVVGEGAEVVGDGAGWLEVGWGVIVIIVGERRGRRVVVSVVVGGGVSGVSGGVSGGVVVGVCAFAHIVVMSQGGGGGGPCVREVLSWVHSVDIQ